MNSSISWTFFQYFSDFFIWSLAFPPCFPRKPSQKGAGPSLPPGSFFIYISPVFISEDCPGISPSICAWFTSPTFTLSELTPWAPSRQLGNLSSSLTSCYWTELGSSHLAKPTYRHGVVEKASPALTAGFPARRMGSSCSKDQNFLRAVRERILKTGWGSGFRGAGPARGPYSAWLVLR